jgi:DNA-binding transcriptional regulator YiaG
MQFVRSPSLCDRVAFLLPGVSAKLRAKKPEVAKLSGDNLPSHLRHRRRQLGLYQKDVAQRLGVAADTLLNWENGRRRPPSRYEGAINTFLGAEID